MRLVLASASPARARLLARAGLGFDVVVSGVDEEALAADSPAELVALLARAKVEAVLAGLDVSRPTIVVGADTVALVDGRVQGKPHSPEVATARWRAQRGRTAQVLTVHHVVVAGPDGRREASAVGVTTVHFAAVSDAEIDAYVATGEPLTAAGAFQLDGRGGAFVERIEGDHHNVVGLSLPLLRHLFGQLGVGWGELLAEEVASASSQDEG